MQIGPEGILGRVTATCDEGFSGCIDLRSGKTATFQNVTEALDVGDIVLISGDPETGEAIALERVPSSAWPNEFWVGIVKVKLNDITVIDASGRFRTVKTVTEPSYEVGNTVQASDVQGVTRVLSEKPIKYIELPELDESIVEQFRSNEDKKSGLGFEDFGGLKHVVARARELIEVQLQNAQSLSTIGARPIKGVLFTGGPGTGKTMLARIIASQTEATFFEISGPQIFSKWYGQSEEVLRKLFSAAASEEKAIIFFDEIDSVAAQRADESHEVSKRVVAQLLTLMDGFKSDTNVVVIAATNRPQDIDVALRRPGRFDWEIEFPYPDINDRIDILEKTSSQLKTTDSLPHAAIAARSDGWSAAELTQIWSEAALLAVQDQRKEILSEDYLGGYERVSKYRDRSRDRR